MSKIKSFVAREILDSRGNPTIEATCFLESEFQGTASVPSGASTGANEASELRDQDLRRYRGLGVLSAVANVNVEINNACQNREMSQEILDESLIELDGTENKSQLGANAILVASLSFARAVASEKGVELYEHLGSLGLEGNDKFILPQPMFNIINGGKHADSELDIQEFMIVPISFKSISEKIRVGAEVISSLRKLLKEKDYAISVGDEGGFAPKLSSNEGALQYLIQAITNSGYSTDSVKIAIDVASSSFYYDGSYHLKILGKEEKLNSDEMVDWYEKLSNEYPIISIEDGLAEEDWEGFTKLNEKLGEKIRIVGDDLTVTNPKRIKIAYDRKAVNTVIIKPNQIGTLTETIEAINLTKKQGWSPFVSHRSGETVDTFIADLSVGLSCPFIKSGSLTRGERVTKYNRLMEIEAKLTAR